jgi:adenosylcobinamide kinase / adenosylcobinamide-phosphate guanylyltransferase
MSQISLEKLTTVLGAAASGKSIFAERLVRQTGLRPVYIATAQAHDAEMEAKIAAHRRARGAGWRTVEAPLDLPAALAGAAPGDAVLIDCATFWLSNLMLAGADLAAAEAGLFAALDACPAPIVVVTNEVGAGVVPETALGRAFREAQGRLNQRLAARSGLVVQVVAGLPQVLKGRLP